MPASSAGSSRRRIPTRRTATSSASLRPTRKSGLASELYERLFEAARAAGRTSVHCVTSPKNTASIAFHTRIGFEVTAEVAGYDGSGESRVLLQKRL